MSDDPNRVDGLFFDDDEFEEYDCEDDRDFLFWLYRYLLALIAAMLVVFFFWFMEWHKNRHKRREEEKEREAAIEETVQRIARRESLQGSREGSRRGSRVQVDADEAIHSTIYRRRLEHADDGQESEMPPAAPLTDRRIFTPSTHADASGSGRPPAAPRDHSSASLTLGRTDVSSHIYDSQHGDTEGDSEHVTLTTTIEFTGPQRDGVMSDGTISPQAEPLQHHQAEMETHMTRSHETFTEEASDTQYPETFDTVHQQQNLQSSAGEAAQILPQDSKLLRTVDQQLTKNAKVENLTESSTETVRVSPKDSKLLGQSGTEQPDHESVIADLDAVIDSSHDVLETVEFGESTVEITLKISPGPPDSPTADATAALAYEQEHEITQTIHLSLTSSGVSSAMQASSAESGFMEMSVDTLGSEDQTSPPTTFEQQQSHQGLSVSQQGPFVQEEAEGFELNHHEDQSLQPTMIEQPQLQQEQTVSQQGQFVQLGGPAPQDASQAEGFDLHHREDQTLQPILPDPQQLQQEQTVSQQGQFVELGGPGLQHEGSDIHHGVDQSLQPIMPEQHQLQHEQFVSQQAQVSVQLGGPSVQHASQAEGSDLHHREDQSLQPIMPDQHQLQQEQFESQQAQVSVQLGGPDFHHETQPDGSNFQEDQPGLQREPEHSKFSKKYEPEAPISAVEQSAFAEHTIVLQKQPEASKILVKTEQPGSSQSHTEDVFSQESVGESTQEHQSSKPIDTVAVGISETVEAVPEDVEQAASFGPSVNLLQKQPETSKILEKSRQSTSSEEQHTESQSHSGESVIHVSQRKDPENPETSETIILQKNVSQKIIDYFDKAEPDFEEDSLDEPHPNVQRIKQLSHQNSQESADSSDFDTVSIRLLKQRDSISQHSRSEKESESLVSGTSSLLELLGAVDTDDALTKVNTLAEVSAIMREAGLEHSNLIFGIDYTASNKYQGDESFGGNSLHSIRKGVMNPYQQVIMIMGKTLMPFASRGAIPAFGFGDAKTSDWSVFPLKKDGCAADFDELLRVYTKITPKVILSGPTNFAPLIYQSIEIIKDAHDYHILVIVADGQVTNERATRRAIVDACKYPLSIIVVGVGDGPWDQMRVFDESLPKRPWDNFHFVEFHKIVLNKDNQDVAFALESLVEIPDQYKLIKKLGLLE